GDGAVRLIYESPDEHLCNDRCDDRDEEDDPERLFSPPHRGDPYRKAQRDDDVERQIQSRVEDSVDDYTTKLSACQQIRVVRESEKFMFTEGRPVPETHDHGHHDGEECERR